MHTELGPKVSFNGGSLHGHFELLEDQYLRVGLNVHGLGGGGLKSVVFQNVPGTQTWLGVKDVDHSWTVVLSELCKTWSSW